MRELTLIGVPSSAGAHYAGQERAPAHLRRFGLVTALRDAGLSVEDYGDLPGAVWQPDPAHRHAQGFDAVAAVSRRVAAAIADTWSDGRRLLVLGGDCTIELGVVAGALRHTQRLGLLYFDGNIDLNTPQSTASGAGDSMGISHLLGLGDERLSRLGPRYPMLPDEAIVLFGYHPAGLNAWEGPALAGRAMPAWPIDRVRSSPDAAGEVLAWLDARAERFILHFDVDVLDFTSYPVANIPHYGGFDLDEALGYLTRFLASPRCAALVVTEFNPDRDPAGDLTRPFIAGLTATLAG